MYDGITYQIKLGTGDQGITAENIEKSQHRFQRRYDLLFSGLVGSTQEDD